MVQGLDLAHATREKQGATKQRLVGTEGGGREERPGRREAFAPLGRSSMLLFSVQAERCAWESTAQEPSTGE